VEERDVPLILKQWLRDLERKQLRFEHEENDGVHTFSTVFHIGGESLTFSLTRRSKSELVLESNCPTHGRQQYDLQEKRNKGRSGVLYDHLLLLWKGILPS